MCLCACVYTHTSLYIDREKVFAINQKLPVSVMCVVCQYLELVQPDEYFGHGTKGLKFCSELCSWSDDKLAIPYCFCNFFFTCQWIRGSVLVLSAAGSSYLYPAYL